VSTAGKKGFAVYAADDGYVSTVMYQKWGIGYALFITHRTGGGPFMVIWTDLPTRVLGVPALARYGEHIIDERISGWSSKAKRFPFGGASLSAFPATAA
jgi:hypothetical protein